MAQARRAEVWFADLGEPRGGGHEQAGRRYVVVLQTDDLASLSTTVVVPLTTRVHRQGAATVLLEPTEGGLPERSLALCHQVRVLDVRRLERRQGVLPPQKLSEIEIRLSFVLGLPL